jgi:hypothetical protein
MASKPVNKSAKDDPDIAEALAGAADAALDSARDAARALVTELVGGSILAEEMPTFEEDMAKLEMVYIPAITKLGALELEMVIGLLARNALDEVRGIVETRMTAADLLAEKEMIAVKLKQLLKLNASARLAVQGLRAVAIRAAVRTVLGAVGAPALGI